ncbi:hypothetical protein C8R47DRAFT_1081659 [Mycena vitilis]|nr:hypothetical protein C8R47DRAFT_1081659 [Mycena vitilis]
MCPFIKDLLPIVSLNLFVLSRLSSEIAGDVHHIPFKYGPLPALTICLARYVKLSVATSTVNVHEVRAYAGSSTPAGLTFLRQSITLLSPPRSTILYAHRTERNRKAKPSPLNSRIPGFRAELGAAGVHSAPWSRHGSPIQPAAQLTRADEQSRRAFRQRRPTAV